ncbi:MAG: terpene cyclase/mutase family protein [Kiritimatiellae bacterium]|nr:terpene cyclase/mutase family protein [Kiritimatiellia bacterium]
MKIRIPAFSALAAALVAQAALGADETIESALAKGESFLLGAQTAEGYWSDRQMPALTALPVWALCGMKDGEKAQERAGAVSKGVAYVLSTQREDGGFYIPKPGRGGSGLGNYNTSVCLSSLFESGKAPVAALLKAREYIASSQLTGDDTLAGGFGYDKVSRRRYADLSNTAYALDAMRRTSSLEELRTTGSRVDVDWDKALSFVSGLVKAEGEDAGGAAYNNRTPQAGKEKDKGGKVALRAYGSMTYAAVLSMCHANLDRGDPRVRQSLDYCRKYWSLDENPGMGSQGLYYFYDILARALAAANVDDVGGHDWRKELAAKLVSLQKEDGSWANENNRFWEGDPVLCTSFAMLCLELCRK